MWHKVLPTRSRETPTRMIRVYPLTTAILNRTRARFNTSLETFTSEGMDDFGGDGHRTRDLFWVVNADSLSQPAFSQCGIVGRFQDTCTMLLRRPFPRDALCLVLMSSFLAKAATFRRSSCGSFLDSSINPHINPHINSRFL
jgi:hypothetical protein